MVAFPNSQLVFARVGAPVRSIQPLTIWAIQPLDGGPPKQSTSLCRGGGASQKHLTINHLSYPALRCIPANIWISEIWTPILWESQIMFAESTSRARSAKSHTGPGSFRVLDAFYCILGLFEAPSSLKFIPILRVIFRFLERKVRKIMINKKFQK